MRKAKDRFLFSKNMNKSLRYDSVTFCLCCESEEVKNNSNAMKCTQTLFRKLNAVLFPFVDLHRLHMCECISNAYFSYDQFSSASVAISFSCRHSLAQYPAPPRFCTTTGCPTWRSIAFPIARATRSPEPPGA